MNREEIFEKVRGVLVDALAVDDDEVTPSVSLPDLGAESIDYLDIVFKLEQAFGFKIGQGELFPEGVSQDPKFVKDGVVTAEGLAGLKTKLPHFDFTEFSKDPRITNVGKVLTVNSIVSFVETKLAKK